MVAVVLPGALAAYLKGGWLVAFVVFATFIGIAAYDFLRVRSEWVKSGRNLLASRSSASAKIFSAVGFGTTMAFLSFLGWMAWDTMVDKSSLTCEIAQVTKFSFFQPDYPLFPIVIARLKISNRGANSTVKDFEIFARLNDGKTVRGVNFPQMYAPIGAVVPMTGAPPFPLPPITLSKDDYIPGKWLFEPIASGQTIPGWTCFLFDAPHSAALNSNGVIYGISFKDVNDKKVEAFHRYDKTTSPSSNR